MEYTSIAGTGWRACLRRCQGNVRGFINVNSDGLVGLELPGDGFFLHDGRNRVGEGGLLSSSEGSKSARTVMNSLVFELKAGIHVFTCLGSGVCLVEENKMGRLEKKYDVCGRPLSQVSFKDEASGVKGRWGGNETALDRARHLTDETARVVRANRLRNPYTADKPSKTWS